MLDFLTFAHSLLRLYLFNFSPFLSLLQIVLFIIPIDLVLSLLPPICCEAQLLTAHLRYCTFYFSICFPHSLIFCKFIFLQVFKHIYYSCCKAIVYSLQCLGHFGFSCYWHCFSALILGHIFCFFLWLLIVKIVVWKP